MHHVACSPHIPSRPARLMHTRGLESACMCRFDVSSGALPVVPGMGYGLRLPSELRGLLSVEPEVRQALAASKQLGAQLLKAEEEELQRVKLHAKQLVNQECR